MDETKPKKQRRTAHQPINSPPLAPNNGAGRPPLSESTPLNAKQRAFVQAYAETFNASMAYRMAGYTAKNDNVARVGGHKLLAQPNVRAALLKLTDERREHIKIRSVEALENVAAITRREPPGTTNMDVIAATKALLSAFDLIEDKINRKFNGGAPLGVAVQVNINNTTPPQDAIDTYASIIRKDD